MSATIGIKIANGDFCSILEENTQVTRRLVLTTVHDNQKSVQIDLYKSASQTMADALYIGSLVVDKIAPRPRGEPSIELTIRSGENGTISAESADLENPQSEKQELSLSLKSFEEDKNDYADFDIEEHSAARNTYDKLTPENEEKAHFFPWLPIIILGVILVLIGLGIWFFLANGGKLPFIGERSAAELDLPAKIPPAAPPEPAAPVTPAAPPPVATVPAEPPIPSVQKPAEVKTSMPRPKPPVYSVKVPQTIPPEGALYTLRWGDTLWDISEVYYRNPWLYRNIVRFNDFNNPNLIVSGTEIKIPPQN
ncbi:MAG: Hsp70 family protein [Treponema sp.]|jgi:hypothetical protein|nr:Hsp70 family protein [Treponema sp.]